jgi:hypothetical protein
LTRKCPKADCDEVQSSRRARIARFVARLYNRPSAGEVDLVDTELLLAILVPNACINVVVVQDRTKLRVIVNTLTTRTVDVTVGLEDSGTTAAGAALAGLVDKAAGCALGPADLDAVFLAGGRLVLVEVAALADREEEVMVVAILGNEGAFLCMRAAGLEGNVGWGRGGLQGRIGHVDTEDVVPEGTVSHDELGAVIVECSVDGVVVVAALGGDTGCAVVGPGVHVLGGSDTNGGVLDTEMRDGVVEVVCVADKSDVGSLEELLVYS